MNNVFNIIHIVINKSTNASKTNRATTYYEKDINKYFFGRGSTWIF
jgi:hypothetical protein